MSKAYSIIFTWLILTAISSMSKASVPINNDTDNFSGIKKQQVNYTAFEESFNRLPDDIIEYIFSYSQKKDVPSIQRTCKLWQKINNYQRVWYKYLIRSYLIDPLIPQNDEQDYKRLFQFYASYSFIILDKLNDKGYSKACAVSADGKIVVGNMIEYIIAGNPTGDTEQAFMWQYDDQAMISLGTLNHGTYSKACAISLDGTTIVGTAHNGNAGLEDNAFIWKQGTQQIQSLGHIKGAHFSKARALSADGTTAVGCVQDGKTTAFIWQQQKGMNLLDDLSKYEYSECRGVSADGNVIVGYFMDNPTSNIGQSFMWKQDHAKLYHLGMLNNGRYSHAFSINAAGTIVVGVAADGSKNNQDSAFMWQQDKPQLRSLGSLNGGNYSKATAISLDGTTVVGSARDGLNDNKKCTFIWRQETGMQSFSKVLENQNLLPQGHTIKTIKAVNYNGTVFVGDGIYQNKIYAWHAVIPK